MKKYAKKIIIGVIIVIVVVVGIIGVKHVIKSLGRTYTTMSVKNELELTQGVDATFLTGDSTLIRYTRDGIAAFNEGGREVWNVSYDMNSPIADANGKYTAVADFNTVNLYIIDESGTFNQINTTYSIAKVAVAANGICAVWMDNGTKDYITLYDKKGNQIATIATTTESEGIPVTMEVSPDGTKLVTSYIYAEENVLYNKLAFYNFSDSGSNYVDRLVGTQKYTDRIVGNIEFAGNDLVVAFSNLGFETYNMEVYNELRADVKIEDQIKSVSVCENYVGAVTLDETGSIKYTLYDYDGKIKETKPLDKIYAGFKVYNKEVILYDGTELKILRVNGNDKANLEMNMEVKEIIPVDNKRTYMVIGEVDMETIKLEAEGDK